MKKLLNPMAVLLSVAILITAGGAVNAQAAEKAAKQKQNPKEEFPFNKVGTVTKHDVDICMEAHILYDLNSVGHKTKDWLSTSSKADEALLEKASKDGEWVRVKGTMMVGVEANCKWVKVSSVTPVKKSSQKRALRSVVLRRIHPECQTPMPRLAARSQKCRQGLFD